MEMLHIIESLIGKKAKIKLQPMQLGDVKKTTLTLIKQGIYYHIPQILFSKTELKNFLSGT